MKHILTLFFLALSTQAAAAVIPVTPNTLNAQLLAARSGDTLQLTGQFGAITIKGKSYSPPLTLDLTAAQTGSLTLSGSSGIEVRGGRIVPNVWSGGVYCVGSKHVHLRGLTVQDRATSNGVTFRECSDVVLEASTVTGSTVAISAMDSQDVVINDNDIYGVAADGITIASSQRVTIIRNLCAGNLNDGIHHPDCAQVWSVAGHGQADYVTVSNNTARGGTQGFGDPGGDARGVGHLVVERNDVDGTYPQGVAVHSAGAVVRNNHVHTMPGSRWRTSVNAVGSVVCGNTADAGAGKPAWADAPCR